MFLMENKWFAIKTKPRLIRVPRLNKNSYIYHKCDNKNVRISVAALLARSTNDPAAIQLESGQPRAAKNAQRLIRRGEGYL